MKRMKYLALGISCVFFNVLMAAVDFRGSNYADRIFATEEHPADYFVDANFAFDSAKNEFDMLEIAIFTCFFNISHWP